MPYNFVAEGFHMKKFLCSRLSSSEVRFYTDNGRFALVLTAPPLGGLKGNVRCSCYAHLKAHSRLPINVNWTFCKVLRLKRY